MAQVGLSLEDERALAAITLDIRKRVAAYLRARDKVPYDNRTLEEIAATLNEAIKDGIK